MDGNPVLVGYGGICTDSTGEIMKLYHGSINFERNNSTELEGILVSIFGWLRMTIEGDSCFLIDMDRKLSMGKKDEKTVSNWNLFKMMEALGTLIATNQAWNFGHIRREDDKFYDLIENVGIRRGHNIIERKMQAFKGKYWVDQFHHLDSIDHVATRQVGRGEKMNTRHIICQHTNGIYIPHLS